MSVPAIAPLREVRSRNLRRERGRGWYYDETLVCGHSLVESTSERFLTRPAKRRRCRECLRLASRVDAT